MNDDPVATANSNNITEGAAAPVTGNMLTDDNGYGIDSDVEGDTLTVTAVDATGADQYGTLTFNPDGSGGYTYTVDNNNPAVQALGAGETLTETYTYTVSDGELTDTATLTITIDGVSNAGQIAPTGASAVDYINGTSANFEDFYASDTNPDGTIQYNISKKGEGTVGSVNPGVFFYYTGLSGNLKADAGETLNIFIDQESDNPLFPEFIVQSNDVKLYAFNDVNGDGVIDDSEWFQIDLADNQIILGTGENQGDVTVTYVSTDPNLTYVLGVKYDTSITVGEQVPDDQDAQYSFYTSLDGVVVEGDVGGIVLAPKDNGGGKKGKLTLDGTPTEGGAVLTEAELAKVVEAAIDYWAEQGVDAKSLESLLRTDVRIEDLGGSLLGKTTGAVIRLDDDAAGYGWSDSLATVDTGRLDLLSALVHEFGHVLGLDHDVMDGTLSVGERDLPVLDLGSHDTISFTEASADGDSRGDRISDELDHQALNSSGDADLVIGGETSGTGSVSDDDEPFAAGDSFEFNLL